MNCLSEEDRELIRRARRDGREARGNEEREKREDEKGSHCFFKSSGYDNLEIKDQNLVFSSLAIECIIKMLWCETEGKYTVCVIGEHNVSLYLRSTKN